ncbi:MAG: DUF1257 domain-containing protein [Pirellulaceae bacterium]
MSHIVSITTEVRDVSAIRAACQRLHLDEPVHEQVELFSSSSTGWAVRLQQWRYPIVCQTQTGRVDYDNYEGRWGEQKQLDRFLQAYAVEKAKIEARRQGHSVTEQSLRDGSIKLTVNVGSAT